MRKNLKKVNFRRFDMDYKDETLDAYFREIDKIPLLTAEEEKNLAEKARKGSKSAKTRLVNANLRFVVAIAKSYRNCGLELPDLISEGNIGLLAAVEHFDVSKGYKFISYAVWWIRQSIKKALGEKGRAIRLPLNKVDDIYQIERLRSLIDADKAEEEQIAEISKILGMKADYIRNLLSLNQDIISLSAPVTAENEDTVIGDTFKDEAYPGPEQETIDSAMRNDVDGVLKTLKPRTERILRMRYGIGGYKAMSLKEIGEECGLSRERVRQIENSAVQTLRSPSRRKRLEPYIA